MTCVRDFREWEQLAPGAGLLQVQAAEFLVSITARTTPSLTAVFGPLGPGKGGHANLLTP